MIFVPASTEDSGRKKRSRDERKLSAQRKHTAAALAETRGQVRIG